MTYVLLICSHFTTALTDHSLRWHENLGENVTPNTFPWASLPCIYKLYSRFECESSFTITLSTSLRGFTLYFFNLRTIVIVKEDWRSNREYRLYMQGKYAHGNVFDVTKTKTQQKECFNKTKRFAYNMHLLNTLNTTYPLFYSLQLSV